MTKKLVFGHQNPDTDTIASAIAASYLLNQTMGEETEPVALGEPNAETQFALDYFKVKPLRVIEKAETEQVYLVDHNEAAQSAKNIDEVEVVGVYDHHKINFSSDAPLWFINMPLGSVATILYYEFKKSNIEIPSDVAGMMASAIISDTLLLKSPTTTSMDQPALEALAEIAGIKDYEAYGLELLKAGTDLSSRTAQELIDGDAKSFDFNGHTFRIGQVNTVDIDETLERQSELESAMQAEGYDNFLFVITDILNSNSKALYLGDASNEVAKAFDTDIKNNVIDLPGVVSRKKQVVPPLTAAF
ncbi:manganese-dependent inorganic pyrophosphatase [Weissella koreensis]|uniref:inorganic diphosphatase n=1 Tax=Weissella koreensis TaxID=165096 RepID=A0A7H1MK54_9LACO|nr:manganese-dependent inorganic pyrophosphatase [Weissella koreensis]AEJ22979.1 inorganic pyrophosphatase/exopolyphosphatase [Weissella koreensis KACC 15510]AVH74582.1 manganese-dependent inorganic pyrophosphatase [Weissella koreensis]EJF33931.1 putative manganese-dependent inorganic pyrophosphatase [Weissella koreensis KCTC 3621]EJF34221.1 putative manganese-dependent inorganic pyrophosphatase [Weissella koreensis KCTC 3621]MCZ9310418.1 manganese-dependent inorganic pyrophosphatase [Weissell